MSAQLSAGRADSVERRESLFRDCMLCYFGTAMLPVFASAQETAGAPTEEIVVNLAAGRVVIAVVKDAILIGTVEIPIEPETHVPTPVELSSERAGIILGAVDWSSPSAQKTLARLDHRTTSSAQRYSRSAALLPIWPNRRVATKLPTSKRSAKTCSNA